MGRGPATERRPAALSDRSGTSSPRTGSSPSLQRRRPDGRWRWTRFECGGRSPDDPSHRRPPRPPPYRPWPPPPPRPPRLRPRWPSVGRWTPSGSISAPSEAALPSPRRSSVKRRGSRLCAWPMRSAGSSSATGSPGHRGGPTGKRAPTRHDGAPVVPRPSAAPVPRRSPSRLASPRHRSTRPVRRRPPRRRWTQPPHCRCPPNG
jgi:hypothetical protein